MSIEHISTNLIVDPLIKGLSPKIFTGHVKNMGIMLNVVINGYFPL